MYLQTREGTREGTRVAWGRRVYAGEHGGWTGGRWVHAHVRGDKLAQARRVRHLVAGQGHGQVGLRRLVDVDLVVVERQLARARKKQNKTKEKKTGGAGQRMGDSACFSGVSGVRARTPHLDLAQDWGVGLDVHEAVEHQVRKIWRRGSSARVRGLVSGFAAHSACYGPYAGGGGPGGGGSGGPQSTRQSRRSGCG